MIPQLPPSPFGEVDEIPLSRPKRNISRDFADGVGNLDGNLMRNKFQRLGCFQWQCGKVEICPVMGCIPLVTWCLSLNGFKVWCFLQDGTVFFFLPAEPGLWEAVFSITRFLAVKVDRGQNLESTISDTRKLC